MLEYVLSPLLFIFATNVPLIIIWLVMLWKEGFIGSKGTYEKATKWWMLVGAAFYTVLPLYWIFVVSYHSGLLNPAFQ